MSEKTSDASALEACWPGDVPFVGKPRHAEDGSVIDWLSLHLSPPSPEAPWMPAKNHRFIHRWGLPEFHPAPQSAAPGVLTRQQIDAWNRDGYVLPSQQVLSSSEVARHAALWQEMYDAHAEGDVYGINGFFKRYGGAYDLVCHPGIVALVRDLLGPNVACWGAHYLCKQPQDGLSVIGIHRDGSTGHHQDGVFWPFRPARQAIVWLALDDTDEENGAMTFYPGSHQLGIMHRPGTSMISRSTMKDVQKRCGPAVTAGPLRAGQLSIHTDLLIHGSPLNRSSRRRLGVSIQYTAMDGVSASGEHWGHGVAVPEGSVIPRGPDGGPNQTFLPLPRPTVYGPRSAATSRARL
eukprot:gnl/TRDRNA2_/TRDRNA2_93734_c0_seq1.p1 gnl/TRDRNA2_/TRDRNA2_93734_c0~~gnl/TRDRNA2_/TRDRNA2_93734_c0_seq1.p1  ORF type:complete len:350 (-),score=43.30 gnl/TRDRNA2_/TRDRNA2_93734_c0_seq1:85-1134(-)